MDLERRQGSLDTYILFLELETETLGLINGLILNESLTKPGWNPGFPHMFWFLCYSTQHRGGDDV